MCARSRCCENFLTAATFTTLSNDIPTLVVMAVGGLLRHHRRHRSSVGSVMALVVSVLSMAMVRWAGL